jgi:hypothetical protein
MATDRELYEEMYARQLAEGHDLETAMRFNKAATPEDFRRAFGTSDDPRQQWRKWGGGNKMGSAGAAVNAARKAQKAARDAARNPPAGSYGVGTATSPAVDTNVNRHVEGHSSEQPGITNRADSFLSGFTLGEQPSVHSNSLEGTLMAVTPWAKVGAWEKNFLQDSLRNIQKNQPGAYDSEKMRLTNMYPGFQA